MGSQQQPDEWKKKKQSGCLCKQGLKMCQWKLVDFKIGVLVGFLLHCPVGIKNIFWNWTESNWTESTASLHPGGSIKPLLLHLPFQTTGTHSFIPLLLAVRVAAGHLKNKWKHNLEVRTDEAIWAIYNIAFYNNAFHGLWNWFYFVLYVLLLDILFGNISFFTITYGKHLIFTENVFYDMLSK